MKLIAGLGNPGGEYKNTLHNAGFWALDLFLSKHRKKTSQKKFDSQFTSLELSGEEYYFIKPQCFMNRSGDAVAPFMKDLNLAPSDILVLHDEADFPPGRLQLRKGGSSGGHNGLESIIERLGGKDFWRLRIGVGKDSSVLLADYVLEDVGEPALQSLGEHGAEALEMIVKFGFEPAVQMINAPEFQRIVP